MRTIGNILWFLLAGLWLAIGYTIAGIVMCILIITIPFGVASFRIAGYALWPFGRVVVRKQTAGGGSVIGNIIWFILAGCGWRSRKSPSGSCCASRSSVFRSGSRVSRWRGWPSPRSAKRSSPGATCARGKPCTGPVTRRKNPRRSPHRPPLHAQRPPRGG